MNDLKKSDSAIVAVKQANKERQRSAEPVEPRAEAKRNSGNRSMRRAQERESVSQAATRIRQAVKRNPEERLVALLHHITVPVLAEANHSLKSDVAAGVDGVTWEMYADGLEDRLADLCDRIHRGAYRAPPVRRVEIPKSDGGKRPLGIATLEDKIVQKAVTDTILVPIYESEFLGFSYGFRQGRGAHNALDALTVGIEQRKISWIIDADIRGFFDNVDRNWLIQFLEHRIGDKRVIRLITKWLNAGVMDGDNWTDTGMGTPQGAIISPILANVYLHYVIDLWIHKTWRGRKAKGDMIVVRYADDFVVGFQHKWEAERFLNDLKERLAHFGLSLHPDKTRLIEFGRFAKANRKRRGQCKPETFNFLGMTHFCAQTRTGKFRVGRKPSRKRVGRTLRRIKDELRKRMHMGAHTVAKWLGRVINGWLNYFAVPGTSCYLSSFIYATEGLFLRAMRRRSQKDRFAWSKIGLLQGYHWPKPTIRHPWPNQRLTVTTQGRSPVRYAHAGICAGGVE